MHATDLEVEVRGIKVRKGEIRAALFDNARDFTVDIEIRATITPSGEVSAGTVRLHFTDLEPGEYAVALFHDRNSDGKLDAMIDRRTLEPWGASNDPRPTKGPVSWEDAKFILPAEGKTIAIQLH